MTTEVKYICDVCGEIRDDEELCKRHERAHSYEGITDADCRIFDGDGRQITFNDYKSDFVEIKISSTSLCNN